MSDSTGGSESGGVAVAGQDSEADSEPPQQGPPLLPESCCVEVGETSEEGAPPSAKRSRMSEEDQALEPGVSKEMPPQENSAPSAQSRIFILLYLS